MLSALLQKLRPGKAFAPPRPERPLAVIGDVHGCPELLQALLAKLPPEAQVVLVGDYIDRGEDSAGVLRFLAGRPDLICLRGNHEDMLLRFLAEPERHGPRWLHYGGLQTLASFGVAPGTTPETLVQCRDRLHDKMGPELMQFLEQLLPSHLSGNVLVAHAGANPTVPVEYQDTSDLVWGHPDFVTTPRKDEIWVAHGHVIHDRPTVAQGRIALDTGAYATGTLSAVYLADGAEPVFYAAGPQDVAR